MRPSRTVLWGHLPIKRSAIPELLADLSTWPTVDTTAFEETDRAIFDSRAEAVRLFVEERDIPIAEITRRTGIHREQLYRQLGRCLGKAEDGRIHGFRGLIRNKHLKEYVRTAPVRPSKPRSKGGAAGALRSLRNRHPKIGLWLERQAKQRSKPLGEETRKVKKKFSAIHKEFLEKCRDAGVKDTEWPFNRDHLGERTLQEFIRRIENSCGDSGSDQDSSVLPTPEKLADSGSRTESGVPQPILPFDAVQFDGHKIDLRITLRYVDPFGLEFLFELTRIWILVALDVVSRAALGFQVVLAPEYDSDEVAKALQSCFGSSSPPPFTIPGLAVRQGGGFPCDLFEVAKHPGWRWFQYDSARANLAEANLIRLGDIVGCFIHTGRLGEPDDRAFIERFFAYLAKSGFHQVPGTTGSNPSDSVRRLGDVGKDLSRLMTVDELLQVVYVMLADYNGESHTGLGGRTPIEALRYWLNKPGVLVRTLPPQKRRQLIFLQEARVVTIVGGSKKQRRKPHINFEGVRYTCNLLEGKAELIGKRIRIYFNIQDIRQLHAFFEDGSELGILIASRSWRRTAHSLRLRKEILRLIRLGKLNFRDGDDAIEAWAVYKRRTAPKDKRSATALAKQGQIQAAAAANVPTATSAPDNTTPTPPSPCGNAAVASGEPTAPDPAAAAPTAEADKGRDVPATQPAMTPKIRPLSVRRTIVFGGNR